MLLRGKRVVVEGSEEVSCGGRGRLAEDEERKRRGDEP